MRMRKNLSQINQMVTRYNQMQTIVTTFILLNLTEIVLGYIKGASHFKAMFKDHLIRSMEDEESDYQKANFQNTRLSQAKFYYCSFQEAVFVDAKLSVVTCLQTDFIGAIMTRASLRYLTSTAKYPVDFTMASMNSVTLFRAKLPKATFTDADCSEMDFDDADLTGAHFERTCLLGANLTKATLTGTVLSNFPKIFLIILTVNRTPLNLLTKLLKHYIEEKITTDKKHISTVKLALSAEKLSLADNLTKFSILTSELNLVINQSPPEQCEVSLAKCVEFAEFCSGNCLPKP